jgi:hypothetical protein
MPFIILVRDPSKPWADAYGLFRTRQDAQDHVDSVRDKAMKYYIAEASDEEIDRRLAMSQVDNGPQLVGTRQVVKRINATVK